MVYAVEMSKIQAKSEEEKQEDSFDENESIEIDADGYYFGSGGFSGGNSFSGGYSSVFDNIFGGGGFSSFGNFGGGFKSINLGDMLGDMLGGFFGGSGQIGYDPFDSGDNDEDDGYTFDALGNRVKKKPCETIVIQEAERYGEDGKAKRKKDKK